MTQQNLSSQFLRRVRKGIFIKLESPFGQANRTVSLAPGELNNDRSQSAHQRLYLLVKNNLYYDSKES